MADTTTAPASSGTPAVPATPAVDAITAAGAALKGKTWADAGFPAIADMTVTDGADDGDDTAGDVVSDRAPNSADTATDSGATAPEGEFVQDAQGKWHRGDGTMASADEITAIEAQLAAESQPKADEPKAEEPKGETVTLRRRDGTTRDVIVDDAELAQEIRQNMNDGMRKREFLEKSAAVEAEREQYQEFHAMLRTNPEAVILQHLPPEKQVKIATALLAQYFDDLIPAINQFNTNAGTRIATVAETQTAIRDNDAQFQTLVTAKKNSAEVKQAVAAMIPDTAPEPDQEEFWKLASLYCTAEFQQGRIVTKDNVKEVLKPLTQRFGFDGAASGTAAPTKPRIALAPASPPAAVPANDAAKALAEKTQRRIKLTQTARTNAAAIPPQGAGAAPVRLPPVPAGASIEEAARLQKQQRGWTS